MEGHKRGNERDQLVQAHLVERDRARGHAAGAGRARAARLAAALPTSVRRAEHSGKATPLIARAGVKVVSGPGKHSAANSGSAWLHSCVVTWS
jgi:hypothetical protein